MTLRDRLAAAMDEELAKHDQRTTRAIEAMREAMERIEELEALLGDPTPEMIKAGATCKPWMAGWPKGEEAAADVWRAMVAKALGVTGKD